MVRFLAQWRGYDSCPEPLLVGERQLCPLKPEPWHPTAELGKETPLQALSLVLWNGVCWGDTVDLAGGSWVQGGKCGH